MRALAIDVGSSSVRTALVSETGVVTHVHQRRLTISSPQPGEVELDSVEIGRAVLELAERTLADGGACDAVGITNQRATTLVFDPLTSTPLGPTLGWQDLRTVLDCLVLQGEGLRLAPNQSATKAKWLVDNAGRDAGSIRFATIETWVAWLLTEGAIHVTDRSNAAITGLVSVDVDHWDGRTLELLGLDPVMMPRIVDTIADHGRASALLGAPPITALIGDQSASMFGQSIVRTGAKITFGTGAMLNMVRGSVGPVAMTPYDSGCFPIVARSHSGVVTWGLEGIVLSAGSALDWARDELGLIEDVRSSASLARSVPSTDGVWFVPALSGLGTPYWDFGARGGFFGLTRGSSRAHLVRAILEGIAHRGADLVDAAERETQSTIAEIRVDGGMSANDFLVQHLADVTGRPVAVSSEREATTRGAGLMALVGAGFLSVADVEALWHPTTTIDPQIDDAVRATSRDLWRTMVARAAQTIPELSAVSF
ncbi:MAG: FGGY family carbohydrate kinase [Acidimicrobiales bacterium]